MCIFCTCDPCYTLEYEILGKNDRTPSAFCSTYKYLIFNRLHALIIEFMSQIYDIFVTILIL